jgi:hypothetical protein
VLYAESGSHLSDLGGMLGTLVDKVLLPVAKVLGFKADYPSHRSKGAQTSSSSSDHGKNHEEL